MSLERARQLSLKILPNGDYASLADKRHKSQSMGEVDLCVTEVTTNAQLRLRALVMEHLAAECYGGTTFAFDNDIIPIMATSTVYMHGGKFKVTRPPTQPYVKHPPPQLTSPPSQSNNSQLFPLPRKSNPSTASLTQRSLVMKKSKSLLPHGTYSIPIDDLEANAVLICPPTPSALDPPEMCWPPQICDVKSGSAIYVNLTDHALNHQKNAHFRVIPSILQDPQMIINTPSNISASAIAPEPPLKKMLSQIKINTDVLNPKQLQRLHDIHTKYHKAFNEDMRNGFTDPSAPYEATFSFRQEHKAPPFKIWAPQFNRQCMDLQQAVCDKLEAQGVMVDPAKANIPIRHVSPSFITQKARAKHKPLGDCSVDEVRFITCCNALNDSIHPIAGRSNTYNDILTFLGRWKYLIFADLTSSYFQIKIAPNQLKYMGIMTPHRGIRIMTRLQQGLLNSDVHLDQVLGRVLGDEKVAGFCCVARDDLHVGGNTLDECIGNWEAVLSKLDAHNLKVSPSKVRIFLQDSEVFGHRVTNGTIRPSDHIVSSLAATKMQDLITVKQVRSWIGLYKTLSRHLPRLALYMEPFDHALKNLAASSTFDWTRPGLVAAFNAATSHLDQVRATYLPKPDEQLCLMPDTSTTNLCAGWVLYTKRPTGQHQGTNPIKKGFSLGMDINQTVREGPFTPLQAPEKDFNWLPVQYMSGKLAPYMANWSPCEQEAVGAVMAIDQGRHWINESRYPTWVLPDSKSVVDAANLMRMGKHSTNPRLQTLLASVNRSPVNFRHNSARKGHHLIPDALSRTPSKPCTAKDCQIERFLEDMPRQVQFMAFTLASLFLEPTNPAILAASAPEVSKLLGPGSGPIPLGSRETWIALQSQCPLSTKFIACKAQGQIPNSQARDKAGINRLFKTCDLDKGLIVSKSFDGILMRETTKVFVPPDFLPAILTIMHMRLDHPLPSQLVRIFERYFIAFNVRGTVAKISEECSLCCACKKFPRQLDTFSPSPSPDHPGTHMNADVLKRAGQLILVNTDRFSNFTTATFIKSEQREDLAQGLLQTITPVRHHSKVSVRTDRARAFLSLSQTPDKQLVDNGIELVLGDHANPNSNASVDKTMQDLEREIVRIDPNGGKISPGLLALAVTHLNNRIRQHGLSASQVHFARDEHTGENLSLSDSKLKAVREDRKRASPHHTERGNTTPTSIKPGQIVYVKNEGDKHTLRNPFLVTSVSQDKVTGNKLLHSSLPGDRAPKFTSQLVKMDPKFLFAPPQSTVPIKKGLSLGMNINQTMRKGPFTPLQPLPPWQPTRPYQAHLEDSDNEGLPQPHHLEDWQLNIGRERVEREDSSDEEEDGDSNEEESGDSNEEEESGDSSEEGGGDDPHEEADPEDVEQGGHEDHDEVQQLPNIRGASRKRRRTPREEWIIAQDAGGGEADPEDVEQGGHEEDDEVQQLPHILAAPRKRRRPPREEWIVAQIAGGPAARPRRQPNPPDRLGIEQEREGEEDGELHPSPDRQIMRLVTPLSSAQPSPDTTATEEPSKDVLTKHRHFSIEDYETDPNVPYAMLDWMPYPNPCRPKEPEGPGRRWSF